MDFCKAFNAKTAKDEGLIIPVVITVYADRSYTFITKTPPVAVLIKREAGIAKGSGEPNKNKVGKITMKQVEEIAKLKLPDLNGRRPGGRGQDRAGHGPQHGSRDVGLVDRSHVRDHARASDADRLGSERRVGGSATLKRASKEESRMGRVGKKYREGQGGRGGEAAATRFRRPWRR